MIEWAKRWPSFKPDEVLSPDQRKLLQEKKVLALSEHALDTLQEFRHYLGEPIKINHAGLTKRGARSLKEVYEVNRETRGKERGWEWSFHLWCAFDISCDEIPPDELYTQAFQFGKWGGIGLYNTFVHVDTRCKITGQITTWDNRT